MLTVAHHVIRDNFLAYFRRLPMVDAWWCRYAIEQFIRYTVFDSPVSLRNTLSIRLHFFFNVRLDTSQLAMKLVWRLFYLHGSR